MNCKKKALIQLLMLDKKNILRANVKPKRPIFRRPIQYHLIQQKKIKALIGLWNIKYVIPNYYTIIYNP